MNPIIKWAGGKRYLADSILETLPKKMRLVEPFVGSGAVSLKSDYEMLWWNDLAIPLILAYRGVRNDPSKVNDQLMVLIYIHKDEEGYYEVRNQFNEIIQERKPDVTRVAAMLIYLNKIGYNGLYRTNKSGGYNVPFGKRLVTEVKWPTIVELRMLAARLEKATLSSEDFTSVLSMVDDNDVVYCDPPYLPLKSGGYTGYVGTFTFEDHQRLAESAALAADKGATVLVSNHDSRQARELYKDATEIYAVDAPRSISRCGTDRKKAKEVFALYVG